LELSRNDRIDKNIISKIPVFKFRNKMGDNTFNNLFNEVSKNVINLRESNVFLCHAREDSKVTE
jgi:hypothetical protein